jgi:hypothetical protein
MTKDLLDVKSARAKSLVFYVYVPAYRSNSAGIRVLYLLADKLQNLGHKTFLVVHNPSGLNDYHSFPVPVLTQTIADLHLLTGVVQVVIYSETVVGNPLRAQNVVRYFLNYPGALGGTAKINPNELNVAYSQSISKTVEGNCAVLFIPAVDLSELPRNVPKDSNLNLVYAGKYRAFIGEPKFNYGVKVTEIFRDGRNRQERPEVLKLLAAANRIYVWENSTIATEAVLLNTPVIFIKNPFLGEIIAEFELGLSGSTFGTTEMDIEVARAGLQKAQEVYRGIGALTDKQIDNFVNLSNEQFLNRELMRRSIRIPGNGNVINMHRVRMFLSIVRHRGIVSALRVVKEFGYIRLISRSNR